MPSDAPVLAVVSAVYNVDRYLGDFLASLDAQTIDHSGIKVVLVNDGSTDQTAETLEAWAARTKIDATVVHQENAGQGAARNAGLEAVADADWVTFIDPDDFIAPDYFERILNFIDANPTSAMVVGHQFDYVDDGREKQVDNHPLRFRFAGGDQLVDVDRFPRFIHMHAASTFIRMDDIRRVHARFDTRIRPNFEDGHFVNNILLSLPQRHLGFVASAIYHYRRRVDGTSTLQNAATNPRRYTDVLRFGYLDLLSRAAQTGPVPAWLQNIVIYELHWTFKGEESMFSATAGLDEETCKEFHALVAELRTYLDDNRIEEFDIVRRSISQREVLLRGYSGSKWRWPEVRVDSHDQQQGLIKLIYRYTGPAPAEQVYVRGLPVAPMRLFGHSVGVMG